MAEETGSTESGIPESGNSVPKEAGETANSSASAKPNGGDDKAVDKQSSKEPRSKSKGKSGKPKPKGGNKPAAAEDAAGEEVETKAKSDTTKDTTAESSNAKSAKTEAGTESGSTDSGMINCPVCGTELKSWQINCHGCGQSISSFEIPVIQGEPTIEPDLMKAFQKWMRRGKLAFKNASYDEAHACFAEALKRVHGLDSQKDEEIKARQKLADAFVKLNKLKEAVEQLVRASQLCEDEQLKETLEQRIDYLNKKGESAQKDSVLFRQPREAELMSAPLYCTQCHRLLSEREVYRFRSGKHATAKCVCAFEGPPVTAESDSSTPIEPLPLGPPLGIKKAKLIEAAQKPVEGGRDRKVAIWLAVFLGNFGIHKFYLGEKALGISYLALCWTAVPWLISLYEAVHIAQMSRVSFNLVYNIEEIVRRLPADVEGEGDGDVFKMEVSEEDPEDLVDAWSAGDEIAVPGA